MKRFLAVMVLLQPFALLNAEVTLDTMEKRLSYTVGGQIGQQLEMEQIPVEREALIQGILDYIDKKDPLIDYAQQQKTIADFQKSLNAEQQGRLERNLLQGQAYMKANATKRGVKATKSGLQYQVLKAGKGAKPAADDNIKVHYEGRLVDGTVFDSSINRGEPSYMSILQVIPGWKEALPMMPVGSKWQLVIPPDLAYGEQGSASIPPNATLIFDVELLEIQPKEEHSPIGGMMDH